MQFVHCFRVTTPSRFARAIKGEPVSRSCVNSPPVQKPWPVRKGPPVLSKL
jgi:hypothetical protein